MLVHVSEKEDKQRKRTVQFDWELYTCILWNKLIEIIQNNNLNRTMLIEVSMLDVDVDQSLSTYRQMKNGEGSSSPLNRSKLSGKSSRHSQRAHRNIDRHRAKDAKSARMNISKRHSLSNLAAR